MALQADYLKQMRTITECTAAIARVRDSKKVAHGGSGGGSYTKPQKQTMRDHDKKIAAALNRINGIKEVRIMANQLDFGALRSIMGTADAAPRCAAVPLGRPVTECQDLNSLDPNDPDIDDDELERDMGSDGGVGGGSGVGGGGGGGGLLALAVRGPVLGEDPALHVIARRRRPLQVRLGPRAARPCATRRACDRLPRRIRVGLRGAVEAERRP
jgi:hypothetical protein